MKQPYRHPVLVDLGAIDHMTSALGTSSRPDFSSFPQIPASMGSFDICPNNNPTQC